MSCVLQVLTLTQTLENLELDFIFTESPTEERTQTSRFDIDLELNIVTELKKKKNQQWIHDNTLLTLKKWHLTNLYRYRKH